MCIETKDSTTGWEIQDAIKRTHKVDIIPDDSQGDMVDDTEGTTRNDSSVRSSSSTLRSGYPGTLPAGGGDSYLPPPSSLGHPIQSLFDSCVHRLKSLETQFEMIP